MPIFLPNFFCKFPFLDIYIEPWKQHQIIPTTISIFFSFFAYSIAFLHLEMQIFIYLEIYTEPWKQYPPTSYIPHFPPEFFPILFLFFI
jgi:hypothetical protein